MLLKLKEMYAVYLGYMPASLWSYFWETLIKGGLAWIPGLLGVCVRNLGYRLILERVGPLSMILRAVDLRGCRSISLGPRAKLRKFASIRCFFPKNHITLAANTSVHEYAIIKSRGGDIFIGENSFVSSFVNISAKGRVHIGKNVMLANGCRLETGSHGFEDVSLPIKEQEAVSRGIVIEDDCWLGAGVIVVDGVRIGQGSVIGAGSVVTRDIPAFSIAAGAPARVFRTRTTEEDQGSSQRTQKTADL